MSMFVCTFKNKLFLFNIFSFQNLVINEKNKNSSTQQIKAGYLKKHKVLVKLVTLGSEQGKRRYYKYRDITAEFLH